MIDILNLFTGGVIGAAAALVFSAMRLKSSFEYFESAFRAYFAARNDPASREVVEAFESFSEDVHGFESAVDRLKKALHRK